MAISPPEISAAPSAAATLSRKAISASVRVSMAVPVIAPLAWILMPSRPLCSLRSRSRLRLRLRGLGIAVLGAGDAVGAEPIADVAHGVDGVLEVFAEFRTQPSNMHVNGAGAAEVVVSPHSHQELSAGEDPFGMHGEELQQRELAIGQIEAAPAEVGGECGLVDAQGAGDDDHRLPLGIPRPAAADTGRTGSRQTACRARDTPRLGAVTGAEATARAGTARLGGEVTVTGHAQPGLHLGGAGGGEEEIGDAPLRRGGRQPSLAEYDDDGSGDACGAQRLGDARGQGEIEAGVDDDDIGCEGFAVER